MPTQEQMYDKGQITNGNSWFLKPKFTYNYVMTGPGVKYPSGDGGDPGPANTPQALYNKEKLPVVKQGGTLYLQTI